MVKVCLEFSPAACWSIDKEEVLQTAFVLGIGGISEQEITGPYNE